MGRREDEDPTQNEPQEGAGLPSAQHVDPTILETRRNWPIITGFTVAILAIGGFVARMEAMNSEINKMAISVEAMRELGHPEHERRITALENQKADQTAVALNAMGKNVDSLTNAMRSDHDVLVRAVVAIESLQRAQKN